MPRKRKNVRLCLRRERYDKRTGKLKERANWIIRDGARSISTGCTPDEVGEAERKLAAYIAEKYSPRRRERDIENTDVADVLSIYYDAQDGKYADSERPEREKKVYRKKLARIIKILAQSFGGMMLSDITDAACRNFIHDRGIKGGSPQVRGNRGNAREYLEVLRAAINYHAKKRLHQGEVTITLPPKPPERDEWLTRREAARLLRVCWRTRECQPIRHGLGRSMKRETPKYPLRHIARFILIGLYTGTRASAIAAASPIRQTGHAWVDLENGIYYRREIGKEATRKKQTPVRLPRRLLAHMRRWHDKGIANSHFVEWRGKPVQSIKTGFRRAVKLAGLPKEINRHTLRHTCVTWLLQQGVSIWEVAGFVGMSPQMVERVYGHHHPDFQSGAVSAFERRSRGNHSLERPASNPIGRHPHAA